MEVHLLNYGKERRLYRRVADVFNVRVVRESKADGFHEVPTHIAKSVNISGGGIYIAIDEMLNEKEIVRVTFLAPNTFELFEGRARVLRITERQETGCFAGLKFVSASAADMKKMDLQISLRDA